MFDFQIIANSLQKKYNRQIIIDQLSFTYKAPESIAIIGANGKGKSTLLQILSGYITPNSGSVEYLYNQHQLKPEDFYRCISIAAPYLDLIENFKLQELVEFQLLHKPADQNLNAKEIIHLAYLNDHQNKTLATFSSGMKQRLKLVLAITANVPLIFLDEPTSNLDIKAKYWLSDLFSSFCKEKLVFVASNSVPEELMLTQNQIQL
jgi:ABC-type multidrug transport system ATPase subunit